MSSFGEGSESEANDTTEESSSEYLPGTSTCSDEDITDERNENNEHSDNNDNNSTDRADDTEGGVADNSLSSRGSGDTTNQNDENAGTGIVSWFSCVIYYSSFFQSCNEIFSFFLVVIRP